jgi:hypothetical protein
METAPDLSLMAKARIGFEGPYGLGINQFLRGMGGPEYIASFLLGFDGREEMQAARCSTTTPPMTAGSRWRRCCGTTASNTPTAPRPRSNSRPRTSPPS